MNFVFKSLESGYMFQLSSIEQEDSVSFQIFISEYVYVENDTVQPVLICSMVMEGGIGEIIKLSTHTLSYFIKDGEEMNEFKKNLKLYLRNLEEESMESDNSLEDDEFIKSPAKKNLAN
jgi:hypothetical protein